MRIVKANIDDVFELYKLQLLAFESEAEMIGSRDIPALLETKEANERDFANWIVLKIVSDSGKNNTAYEHCELSVNGEGFLALAEAKNPCDIALVHKYKWETMTFNVFEMGTEEAVYNAFQVLSEDGVIIEGIHELPWSKCCATVIDKFGVCWWISI